MSIVVLLEIQVKPEALDEMKAFIKKIGTFQNRAKVVDSIPSQLSAMAGCRHTLALKQSVQAG